MNQSEHINELMTALAKAQGSMGHAVKDSENPHFKSKYADLAAVWEACRDPLAKNGLAVTQTIGLTEGQQILVTTLGHTSGQWMRSTMILPMCNRAQEMGSILTYFRRYSLAAMCGVYQDDDDGNEAQKSVDMRATRPLNSAQKKELKDLLAKLDKPDLEQFLCERGKIKSLYDTPAEKYHEVMEYLTKQLNSKAS